MRPLSSGTTRSCAASPWVVAWKGKRSVVYAASYEARRFGVRSAMAAIYAERLCPKAIFVPLDLARYRAVSHAVREILLRHTDLAEPLSLDEAYLDVIENKTDLATATKVAIKMRQQIRFHKDGALQKRIVAGITAHLSVP
jgi:DNA polymerase IV